MAPALAAHRASEVLRHLARHPDRPSTLSELAAELQVAPASLHGVLQALTDAALVEREAKGKRYRLGPEAVLVGAAARSQRPDYALALRVAESMAADHGLAATAIARRDDDLVALDGVGDLWGSGLGSLGSYRVLAAPGGGCFLAGAKHHQVLAWLARGGLAPESHEAEELRRELDRVAQRGWSLERSGGATAGVTVMAAIPGAASALPTVAVACRVPAGVEAWPVGAALAARVRSSVDPMAQAG